jgi:peroxiredoxin
MSKYNIFQEVEINKAVDKTLEVIQTIVDISTDIEFIKDRICRELEIENMELGE